MRCEAKEFLKKNSWPAETENQVKRMEGQTFACVSACHKMCLPAAG
jgi:hypothetical protein